MIDSSSDMDEEAVARRENDEGSDKENAIKREEDAAKEKQKIRKKVGPRVTLNAERLKGPHGLASMERFFSDVHLSGRLDDAARDLDKIMSRLEHWVYRLYPHGKFEDNLKKIEKLGSQKGMKTYIKRLRLDLEDDNGESNLVRDVSSPPRVKDEEDPFDQIINRPPITETLFSKNSSVKPSSAEVSSAGTFITGTSDKNTMTKKPPTLEQKERILRNRLLAEERKAARLKRAQESNILKNGAQE